MMIFGEKEDKEYTLRQAVYGVMFSEQNDKIAVVRTERGNYFLPGGGLEDNETHEECLKREALEEIGMAIEVGPYIGSAQQYFSSPDGKEAFLHEGHFYFCFEINLLDIPSEEDHFLEWMDPAKATKCFFHQHQSWAIKEALRINGRKGD
jgi:8-oxo-dGTP diphosphatase